MTVQSDSREHMKEWQRISAQFDELGVKYFRSKLYVGDYMSLDNPRIVIDRKQDLQEIIGNVTTQHRRFIDELKRAQEHDIKVIILCEHGEEITRLEDIVFWENPRRKMFKWVTTQTGQKRRVLAYPKATTGQQLYKILSTISEKYGVDFEFCTKDQTGKRIVEILERG